MSEIKKDRAKEAIMHSAAEFIAEVSNYTSLITVTNIMMRNKEKDAYIMLTVMPNEKEDAVIDFLNRKKNGFREFLKKKVRLRILPYFHFEIDRGEKNRQKIDDLMYEEERNRIEK